MFAVVDEVTLAVRFPGGPYGAEKLVSKKDRY